MTIEQSLAKQTLYSEILNPTPKISYNYQFFTTLHYTFTDIKETYSGSDKKIVKIFKIFAKLCVMLLVGSIKLLIAVTIITPLVFEAVSIYKNRKITTGNKDLKRKAIAFVKASEAHQSLGNVTTAVKELSNQCDVMTIDDPTKRHALRNITHFYQDKARIHYNLMVTAQSWGDIVKARSESLLCNDQLFDKKEFFEYAVKTLIAQGHINRMNINQMNATLSLRKDLT